MTQKDPGGDVIEDIEGQRLIDLIEESGSMAVYFCKFLLCTQHSVQSLRRIHKLFSFFVIVINCENYMRGENVMMQ